MKSHLLPLINVVLEHTPTNDIVSAIPFSPPYLLPNVSPLSHYPAPRISLLTHTLARCPPLYLFAPTPSLFHPPPPSCPPPLTCPRTILSSQLYLYSLSLSTSRLAYPPHFPPIFPAPLHILFVYTPPTSGVRDVAGLFQPLGTNLRFFLLPLPACAFLSLLQTRTQPFSFASPPAPTRPSHFKITPSPLLP